MLQEVVQQISIERIVTALGPLFAAGASFICAYVSQHLGVKLDPSGVAAIESAAFLGTCAVIIKWLNGRQIPQIAGLALTDALVAQLHAEVEEYLAQVNAGGLTNLQAEVSSLESQVNRLAPPPIDDVVEAVLERIQAGLRKAPPGTTGTAGAAAPA